jgi:hypothetical protein
MMIPAPSQACFFSKKPLILSMVPLFAAPSRSGAHPAQSPRQPF